MLLRGVGGGFGVHSVGGFLASLYTSWVGSKDFIGFQLHENNENILLQHG